LQNRFTVKRLFAKSFYCKTAFQAVSFVPKRFAKSFYCKTALQAVSIVYKKGRMIWKWRMAAWAIPKNQTIISGKITQMLGENHTGGGKSHKGFKFRAYALEFIFLINWRL